MRKRARLNAVSGLLGALALLTPVLTHGAAEPPAAVLVSHWRDGEVKVDGAADEWDRWSPFGQDSRVSVALLNDENSLYMALRTEDPALGRQILRLGLVVWFDAAGGARKRFGVKYPVGTQAYPVAETGRGRGGPGAGGRGLPGRPGAPGDPDSQWAQAEADGRLSRLELIGARADDRRTLMIGKTEPLEVRIGWHEGTTVYELGLPLAGDQYAIGVRPPGNIGIGLAHAEKDSSPGPMRFGGLGRGFSVGGQGSGGGGGAGALGGEAESPGERAGRGSPGGRTEERPKPPSPLNAWIVVRLSAKP